MSGVRSVLGRLVRTLSASRSGARCRRSDEHQALDRENLAQRVLLELREDPLLEAVHELVELVDDREIGVDRLIDDRVHQRGRTVSRQLRLPLEELRGRGVDRIGVGAVHGHEVVLAEEEVRCSTVSRS